MNGVDIMPPGSDKAGDETSKISGKENSVSISTIVLGKIVVSRLPRLASQARLPANNNFAYYHSTIADVA